MRWLSDDDVALFTDLYELTMAASYAAHGLEHQATFDLFVRHLPEERRFLVACGVDDALDYLAALHVPGPCIEYLSTVGLFDDAFLDRLSRLRFTGDVWALPEGEVFFANEPVLEVTAPLIEAQVVETFLINCVGAQTMVASKAARVAIACGERTFVDFAARRVHGVDAGLKGARASVIGGAVATSLVVAGMAYGLPLNGTMAHSYVMSFDDEREAFRTYARDFPHDAVLLIDTYDTVQGARHAAEVATELEAEGINVRGVRLDSGDLVSLAREVRCVLDEAGCDGVRIFASGDLDELRITEVLGAGAPVDGFGVGTQLGTSADAPALAGVYKLVEDVHGPKIKLAEGKVTLPGRKQVHRFAAHDVLGGRDEPVAGGRPLLEPALAGGRRVRPRASITEARDRRAAAVAALPSRLRMLSGREAPYDVRVSDGLQGLSAELIERHRG